MSDDLEERLDRLSPADPPRDLMRRLRAAEPPLSAGQRLRRWLTPRPGRSLPFRLAACGWLLLAAMVWIAVASAGHRSTGTGDGNGAAGWKTVVPPVASTPDDSAPRRATARNVGASLDPDSFLDPAGRDRLALGYSLPGDRLRTRSGDPLRLEAAAGPVRLECGYTLSGSRSASDFFGSFNLNAND